MTDGGDRGGPNRGGRWGDYLLLGVSLAASFLAFEMAVRWTALGDRMGGAPVPSVAERVEAVAQGPSPIPRVVFLGDSFTIWRDTTGASYPRVMQGALDARGLPVEVVNLAEGGSGFAAYYANLVRYGQRLAPDLVVVGIYLGNDLTAVGPRLDTADGAAQAIAEAPAEDMPWWKRMAKKSLALNYAYRLLKLHVPALRSGIFEHVARYMIEDAGKRDDHLAERLAAVPADLVERARADAINPWDLAEALAYPERFGQLAAMDAKGGQDGHVEGGLRNLGVIVAECRRRRIPVAAVLLPPPVWVSERYHPYFHNLGYGELGPVSGPVPVIERVKEYLAGQGIPTLDALPALRAAEGEVYLPEDVHLNTEGQRLVGVALAKMLTENGLIAREDGPAR